MHCLPAAGAADEVEVTGVVIRQFGPMIPGVRCQVGPAGGDGQQLSAWLAGPVLCLVVL